LKPVTRKEYFSLISLLSLTVMLVMAGESMLTAALPDIEHEFSVPGIYESLILPIVLLVGAASSPFVGTAGDRFGHKRILVICLLTYLAGLIFGLFAPNIWILLGSRALQGAGIAAFPLGYAIIKERLPAPKADVGIGFISAMYGAGTFIGVITGSFVTSLFSWRMTYIVLIPAACLLLVLVWKYIGKDHPNHRGGSLDLFGFLTLLVFLLFSMGFISLPCKDQFSPSGILVLCCAILAFLLFIRIETRVPHPLADFQLMQKHPVGVYMAIGFLTIFTFFLLLQMMPYIIRLPSGLALPAEMVGLILIPGTLCDMAAGPLTGRMIPVVGCRIPCILGSVFLTCAGLLLFAFPLSLMLLVLAWMLFSFGMSMVATADLLGVIEYVSEDRTTEATGIIQSMQTLGGMVGPIVTGLIFATSQTSMVIDDEVWDVPQAGTYYLVFFVIIAVSCTILAISSVFLQSQQKMNA